MRNVAKVIFIQREFRDNAVLQKLMAMTALTQIMQSALSSTQTDHWTGSKLSYLETLSVHTVGRCDGFYSVNIFDRVTRKLSTKKYKYPLAVSFEQINIFALLIAVIFGLYTRNSNMHRNYIYRIS